MIKAWKNDKMIKKHCLIYHNIFIHIQSLMKLNSEPEKGGVGSRPRWNAGEEPGLASSRPREADSSTWVEHSVLGSSTLSLNGQAMNSMSNALPPTPPPTSYLPAASVYVTQIHKALCKMKNAASCWPFWHRSRDAESCLWERSWACKKSGRGCFQQWYDPGKLGELHPESL